MPDYVRLVDGVITPFRVRPKTLYSEVAPVCWPWPVPDALLAEYGIFPVVDAGPPVPNEEQKVVEGPIVKDGAVYRKTYTLEALPRSEHPWVTLRAFRLALIELGYDDALLAAINALPTKQRKRVRVELEQAARLTKTSPFIRWMQTAAGGSFTDAQIDTIWAQAKLEE